MGIGAGVFAATGLVLTACYQGYLAAGMSRNGASVNMVLSTMHVFQGLERRLVVASDMGEIGQSFTSMPYYAGWSPARSLLRVFLPETAK